MFKGNKNYIIDDAGSVFLISIYDKSDKENISDNELNAMLEMAGLL
jgi:hypothetical protein